MGVIQNFAELSTTEERRKILDIINFGLDAIDPGNVIKRSISYQNGLLKIADKIFNLNEYENVYLLGFGKGSALNSKYIESILGEKLHEGYVIDTISENFERIHFTQGTHPLPSQANIAFTKNALIKLSSLTEKDLVLVVVCGGGSALLEDPIKTLDVQTEIFQTLLKSGANIHDMNTVRKHLSNVKGGGLAKSLYPATIVSLFFSDVPGNDLSVIASAPTVKDPTSIENALNVLKKYNLEEKLHLTKEDFVETPNDDKYFEKTHNVFILSNLTILDAMQKKASELGIQSSVFSDRFQGEAREAGHTLIEACPDHHLLLAGGETTVTALGNGKGGRNQELVLAALRYLDDHTLISSFGTDGQDNTEYAGAIGDQETIRKAKEQNCNPDDYIQNNDSFHFFEKVGNAIITGRLPSNVSDIMLVYKY